MNRIKELSAQQRESYDATMREHRQHLADEAKAARDELKNELATKRAAVDKELDARQDRMNEMLDKDRDRAETKMMNERQEHLAWMAEERKKIEAEKCRLETERANFAKEMQEVLLENAAMKRELEIRHYPIPTSPKK